MNQKIRALLLHRASLLVNEDKTRSNVSTRTARSMAYIADGRKHRRTVRAANAATPGHGDDAATSRGTVPPVPSLPESEDAEDAGREWDLVWRWIERLTTPRGVRVRKPKKR